MSILRPSFFIAISFIFFFLSASARPPQSPLAQQEPSTNNLCYFFEMFTGIQGCHYRCHREVVTSTKTCTVTKTKTKTTTRLSTFTLSRPESGTKTVTITLPERTPSRTRTTTKEITPTTVFVPPASTSNVPGSPPERGTVTETTTQFVTKTETETETETSTSTQLAIITITAPATDTKTFTSTELISTTLFSTETVIETITQTITDQAPTVTTTLTTGTVTVTSTKSETGKFIVTVPVTRTELVTMTMTISVSVSFTTSTLTTTNVSTDTTIAVTTIAPPLPSTKTAPVLPECTHTLNFDNIPSPHSFFGTLPTPSQLYNIIFQGFILFSPPRGALIPALSSPNYIVRQNTSPILFVSADRKDLFSVVSFAARCSPVKNVRCSVIIRGYNYDDDGNAVLLATGRFSVPSTAWRHVEVKNAFRDIFSGLAFVNISTDAFLLVDNVVISRRRATCLTGF